jgi:hypothetical protein
MKYKITFNAGRDNQTARDTFSNYLSAVRDGLALVDDFLGIYPDYEQDHIEFEVKTTDNLLELSKDKHFKFLNRLRTALYDYKGLLICEQID